VLTRTLDYSFVVGYLPYHVLPSKCVVAYQEIVDGLNGRLSEVKGCHTSAELATKYVILDASISAQKKSSMREVARALRVHRRNIMKEISRRELMHSGGDFLVLTIRRRRNDCIGNNPCRLLISCIYSLTSLHY